MNRIFVIKPVGARCNLRCDYCYYRSKNSGKKTVISDKILETFFRQYLNFPQAEFQFIWHGGEPTLAGIDFFENVISLQKFYGQGKKISNEIQTNGTLVDGKWIDFFQKNQFHIGVSIDGPREIHNRYRRDYLSKGSFGKVMKCISLLKESRLKWGVLVVLTRASLGKEKQIFKFLVKNKIYISDLLPVVSLNNVSIGLDGYFISPEEFYETILKMFDLWWRFDNPNMHIRLFNEMMHALLEKTPVRCVCNSPGCANYFTLDWNGAIYPCEAFMGVEDFNFGNILNSTLTEILASSNYRSFADRTKKEDAECCRCQWGQICPGRCAFDQYKFGDSFIEKDFFCSFRKIFFPYLKKKVKEVTQNGEKKTF